MVDTTEKWNEKFKGWAFAGLGSGGPKKQMPWTATIRGPTHGVSGEEQLISKRGGNSANQKAGQPGGEDCFPRRHIRRHMEGCIKCVLSKRKFYGWNCKSGN